MHPSSPLGKENNSSDEFDLGDHSKSRKKMEASKSLTKYARGRGLNPLSRGRKGSDSMKYSSLSPPERRVASAKTLSDQCFSGDSSVASSSPESFLVDGLVDDEELAETYALEEAEASPESRKIMEEMEQIYQSSPIPKTYINSPPKISQALPEIVLDPKPAVKSKAAGSKVKQRTRRKETQGPSTTSFTATKAAYGGSKISSRQNTSVPRHLSSADASSGSRNAIGCQGREIFSAPNESGGVAKSLERASVTKTNMARTTNKKKPVALSVQREKQQRKSQFKDAKSSSNEVDGRRNLDKRTARLRFADAFNADIVQHRQRLAYLNNGSNHSDKIGSQIQDRGMNGVSIAVRKRPIFKYEIDRGDYDVVSIENVNESSHDVCVVHNCVMHADMQRMLVKPTRYPVTAAFDEHCGDDDVYRHIAEPLVRNAVNEGVATILMYGQTGCGKSYTMSGIETRTAHGLFQAIDSNISNRPKDKRPVVTIQFVELCGSKEIRDLLVKKSAEVKLADDEDGSVRLLNAASHEVKTPEDLLERIMLAKGRRATEATEKNGVSSRSHAVCQIQIKGSSRGVLTLIDCAGSERRHDSMYHTSERQKESAEINASLWALKECVRARVNKFDRIPFRASSLTRVLKESFERDGARLCVIACVAPNATDTEHTMETLKTVAGIVGVDDQIKEEKAHIVASQILETKPLILPPKQWDHNHMRKFLAHKKMSRVQLLEKHDGKALMKMSVSQMRAHLFEDKDKELAQKLFDLLRKENDRVAQIQRKERELLKKERKARV